MKVVVEVLGGGRQTVAAAGLSLWRELLGKQTWLESDAETRWLTSCSLK